MTGGESVGCTCPPPQSHWTVFLPLGVFEILRVKCYVMIFEAKVFLCLDLQMFSGRIQLTNDCFGNCISLLLKLFFCDFVKQKLSEAKCLLLIFQYVLQIV